MALMYDSDVRGRVGRYDVELMVMKHMGWSWSELMAAPADLIDEIVLRQQAEAKWTNERRKMDKALNG